MPESTTQQLFRQTIQHLNGGRLQQAQSLLQQIITNEPRNADATHLLGVVHRRSGNNRAAIDLIRQAIGINPACANAHYNLGNALRDEKQWDDAVAAYRRSIELGQNLQQAWHNLGIVLKDQGLHEQAELALRQEEAAASPRPPAPVGAAEVFIHGNALAESGRFTDAITAYREAIGQNPDFAEAWCNMANALVEENQLDAAITAYRKAILIKPDLPQAHHNLAKAFYDKGELDPAIAANRRALELRPDYTAAYRDLANCLFEAGNIDEAIATYPRAINNDPASNARTDSDLIYTLHFHPDHDAQSIAAATRRWNHLYAESLVPSIHPHSKEQGRDDSQPRRALRYSEDPDRTPIDPSLRCRSEPGFDENYLAVKSDHVPSDPTTNRRLKIGSVSPDLRNHVVGLNLMPLFREHDHQQFEIVCYSDAVRPDLSTQWFQQHADIWRNTSQLSDEQLAQQVRDDGIDILVDLALHTRQNRLLTFARKPAPVQVTFAGYPGTTGLTTIDYRLSDPYLDPPGMDESIYTEKTIRLPNSFWCYDPGDCRDIPVNPLPAQHSGSVTFGCLNNFCKVNAFILGLWARVMLRVPDSRLLLLAKQGGHRQRTIDYLSSRGIAASRVEFVSFSPRRDYLMRYHRIDLLLDTFPYNGHTTSLDSLWMGVPVVTLVGKTAVSRAGWSQLSNLGFTGLAAQTADQFVEIASALANDCSALQQMRNSLRSRMESCPLTRSDAFARDIESAYRQMWRRYCDDAPSRF
jgi:predicted O-linked N-acetylglucosamine transferase (SPINDLY family)